MSDSVDIMPAASTTGGLLQHWILQAEYFRSQLDKELQNSKNWEQQYLDLKTQLASICQTHGVDGIHRTSG